MKNAQIFSPTANSVVLGGGALIVVGSCVAAVALNIATTSPFVTRVGVAISQPVPFSHEHHVGGLGIDCRYCHTTVEIAPFAGIPPTETCMTCHSQVWRDAPVLQPVRDSYEKNEPLQWNRVYDLPGFVYFDHSIHVNHGVACRECHGDVGRMPLIAKQKTLFMKWCLDCHRHPEARQSPQRLVFRPGPPDRPEIQSWIDMKIFVPAPAKRKAANARGAVRSITDCSACHR